jgi:hypothetical protein
VIHIFIKHVDINKKHRVFTFLYPRSPKGEGGILFYLCPSVQDIFRRIFLSNCWWQRSDIWSQASYRYTILWVAFLDLSDSYFLFADLVGYTHWTYMLGYHKWALSHSSSCLIFFSRSTGPNLTTFGYDAPLDGPLPKLCPVTLPWFRDIWLQIRSISPLLCYLDIYIVSLFLVLGYMSVRHLSPDLLWSTDFVKFLSSFRDQISFSIII